MQLAEHGANQITTAPQLAVVAGLAVRLASDVWKTHQSMIQKLCLMQLLFENVGLIKSMCLFKIVLMKTVEARLTLCPHMSCPYFFL